MGIISQFWRIYNADGVLTVKSWYLCPGCCTKFNTWGRILKDEFQDQFSQESLSWNTWKMGNTNESCFTLLLPSADVEITSGWRLYTPFKLSATILSKWKQAKIFSENNWSCCCCVSKSFIVFEVSFTKCPTSCLYLISQYWIDKHWWKSWKIQSTHVLCFELLLKKRSSLGKGHFINWRIYKKWVIQTTV